MTPNNFQESQFISTNRSRQIAPLVENQMQPRYYRHHADPIVGGFRSSPPQSHICKYVCVYAPIQVPLSFLSFFSVYKGSTHLTNKLTVTQIQVFCDSQRGVRIVHSSCWLDNFNRIIKCRVCFLYNFFNCLNTNLSLIIMKRFRRQLSD